MGGFDARHGYYLLRWRSQGFGIRRDWRAVRARVARRRPGWEEDMGL